MHHNHSDLNDFDIEHNDIIDKFLNHSLMHRLTMTVVHDDPRLLRREHRGVVLEYAPEGATMKSGAGDTAVYPLDPFLQGGARYPTPEPLGLHISLLASDDELLVTVLHNGTSMIRGALAASNAAAALARVAWPSATCLASSRHTSVTLIHRPL